MDMHNHINLTIILKCFLQYYHLLTNHIFMIHKIKILMLNLAMKDSCT